MERITARRGGTKFREMRLTSTYGPERRSPRCTITSAIDPRRISPCTQRLPSGICAEERECPADLLRHGIEMIPGHLHRRHVFSGVACERGRKPRIVPVELLLAAVEQPRGRLEARGIRPRFEGGTIGCVVARPDPQAGW